MTFPTSHLPRYLQVALASDPARPRLTYYDDATGERVELSAQTLSNWVTKTMNLLIEEVGVEEGTRVSLHLPLHWLTVVWVMAADAVGAEVTSDDLGTPDAPADDRANDLANDLADDRGSVQITIDGSAALPGAPADEVFAVSLAPMAQPLGARCPAHARDFLAEVRTMPDQLTGAATGAGRRAEDAAQRAAELDLAPHARVAMLVPERAASVAELVQAVLAPLHVDGSVVWTRRPDLATCAARWAQEQVSAVTGDVPDSILEQLDVRLLR